MTIFRRGLKDNVKNKLIRDERDYKSLFEFIEIAIDINDKLYERIIKKRYDRQYNRAEIDYEPVIEYAKSKISYIRTLQYTKSISMKLDMT